MKIRVARAQNELEAVFPVIRELRPHLSFLEYASILAEARARDDYEIIAAFEGDRCIAAMGCRILFDFLHGKHLYIDDLVVTESRRSGGIGAELLKYAEGIAAEKECMGLRLCTGSDRKDSQRFYERNGWRALAVAYKKKPPQ